MATSRKRKATRRKPIVPWETGYLRLSEVGIKAVIKGEPLIAATLAVDVLEVKKLGVFLSIKTLDKRGRVLSTYEPDLLIMAGNTVTVMNLDRLFKFTVTK